MVAGDRRREHVRLRRTRTRAGAPTGAGRRRSRRRLPPLGNGEPVSWTFQPYPGGTGALMEKLVHERGAAAFQRATFTVRSGPARCRRSARDRVPARASALGADQGAEDHVDAAHEDLSRAHQAARSDAALRRDDHGRAGAAPKRRSADAEIKAGKYRGPLHGIPYGVKDLFSTKGVRTTWGSADFENRIIDEDAEVVVRLRNAGAVLMAKLATGLFAQGDQWYRGRTNNPWDIRRGSSGSSAGPASATAAGCVAFGIGTETSGSIVSPARECGLSALRPTFGRVSRYGGMVLAWSQDRVGPICRTIEDCAMVFNTIHGVDREGSVDGDDAVPLRSRHQARVDAHRRRRERAEGVRRQAARARRDAEADRVRGRSCRAAAALGVESAAAFDSYVQMKAKELGIDLATIPEPRAARWWRRWRWRRRSRRAGTAAGAAAVAAAAPDAAIRAIRRAWRRSRAGPAAASRARSISFRAQRRRYILITQMAELLKDLDMYVPGAQAGCDVGLHAQTGHPCAVVPYKFEPQPTGRGGRVGAAARRPTTTARADHVQSAADLRGARGESVQRRQDSVGRASVSDCTPSGTSSIRSCSALSFRPWRP